MQSLTKESTLTPFPIDLVYTWVDGADYKHQQQMKRYSNNPIDLNPERTRDNFSLLKYGLRSVERFLPWFNHIYIVTMRPQVPQWLDTSNENVTVVHHDEIFANVNHLPSFNSHVIESYLHMIPNLTDYFIYLNDDFLFGNIIDFDDFFDEDFAIKLYAIHPIFYRLKRPMQKKIRVLFEHTPLLFSKKVMRMILSQNDDELEVMRQNNRFRHKKDFKITERYRDFMIRKKPIPNQMVSIKEMKKVCRFQSLTHEFEKQKLTLLEISQSNPKFICLNDDLGINPDEKVVSLVQNFLESYFPHPSSFELDLS